MLAALESGLCHCGCGEPTKLSPYTDPTRGYVRGQPRRYVRGHHLRLSLSEYVEEDRGYDSPCWMWQRGLANGYGSLRVDGKQTRAHRHYYARANGPIPEGMELDHLCRNKACVNPDHLEAVTHAENVRRGDVAKLTQAQVQAIKGSALPVREIALTFGVSPYTIRAIRRGESWN